MDRSVCWINRVHIETRQRVSAMAVCVWRKFNWRGRKKILFLSLPFSQKKKSLLSPLNKISLDRLVLLN